MGLPSSTSSFSNCNSTTYGEPLNNPKAHFSCQYLHIALLHLECNDTCAGVRLPVTGHRETTCCAAVTLPIRLSQAQHDRSQQTSTTTCQQPVCYVTVCYDQNDSYWHASGLSRFVAIGSGRWRRGGMCQCRLGLRFRSGVSICVCRCIVHARQVYDGRVDLREWDRRIWRRDLQYDLLARL